MIKWIIFDAMGVVFIEGHDVYKYLVPFIQERNPISTDKIYDVYRRASLGEISSKEFWEDVGLGHEYPQIETMYLDSRHDIDIRFAPIVRVLSKKYGIGLISNDICEWSTYLRKKFSIDIFDIIIVSSDVHCRKPDIPIFKYFLNDTNAHAEECIFIDDRNINLAVAQSIGMKTIHFDRNNGKSDYTDVKSDFIPDGRITSFDELEDEIERIKISIKKEEDDNHNWI